MNIHEYNHYHYNAVNLGMLAVPPYSVHKDETKRYTKKDIWQEVPSATYQDHGILSHTDSSVTKYELNSITLTLHLRAFYVALTSLFSTEVLFSPAETDGETTASSNSEVMEELVLVLV